MTKRKPLSDTLAENFVYGQSAVNPTPVSPQPSKELIEPTPVIQEASLMSRLLEMSEQKEATKRFTVDLPESMHRKLSILAAKTGRKKADIIKTLLEDLLKDLNE